MVFTSLKSSENEKCILNQFVPPFRDYFFRIELQSNVPLNVEYQLTCKHYI